MFVDEGAAGGVDEDDAVFHGGDALVVDEAAGFGIEGAEERDDVGLAEEIVECDLADA